MQSKLRAQYKNPNMFSSGVPLLIKIVTSRHATVQPSFSPSGTWEKDSSVVILNLLIKAQPLAIIKIAILYNKQDIQHNCFRIYFFVGTISYHWFRVFIELDLELSYF